MNNKIIIGLVVVVLLGGAGFWYYQSNNSKDLNDLDMPAGAMSDDGQTMPAGDTSSTSSMDMESSSDAMMMSDGDDMHADAKEFTVSGSNFSFTPKTLTVKKGDKVKITFKNTGGFHDFKIDEFKVATAQIQGGNEETVEFVADKAGSFEYYCSVGKHRAMGMVGTLTVTE